MKLILLLVVLPLMVRAQSKTTPIRVIEFRDYVLQPGQWKPFDEFLAEKIFPQQEALGAHVLNRFRLKDSADNYVWIRGFADMEARSKCLKGYYYSDQWRAQAPKTNSMLIDSYNVYLLKPLTVNGTQLDSTSGVSKNDLVNLKGLVVATFYKTRSRRQLIGVFVDQYMPVLAAAGIVPSLWIGEMGTNDYKPQHIYQDPDLLVTFTRFENEADYRRKVKPIESNIPAGMKRLVVSSTTMLLYTSDMR